jgi:hypothetical protein
MRLTKVVTTGQTSKSCINYSPFLPVLYRQLCFFCRCIVFTEILTTELFGFPLFSWAQNAGEKQPFTVKDSIEISRIIDPSRTTTLKTGEQSSGTPIYSPDGKNFLVVTQRGVVSNNTIESTIWLFDLKRVVDYARTRSPRKLAPRKLITMSSPSNTAIISDVRWSDDSKTIRFLGKDGSPCQRLFIADINSGSVSPVTPEGLYVTSYDIRGSTIAFTVLENKELSTGFRTSLITVGQASIFDLLYRSPPAEEDIQAVALLQYPSSLHLIRNGEPLSVDYSMQGLPLRLFIPCLSLSRSGKTLITVAAVHEVPKDWEEYEPLYKGLRIKSGPVQEKSKGTLESLRRPEQFVAVNLDTGSVSPLIPAPAGRDLGYGGVPTMVFWLEDDRRAIITNTYLPFSSNSEDERTGALRKNHAAIAVVDIASGHVGPSVDLRDAPMGGYYTSEIRWDAAKRELTLRYEGETANSRVPPPEKYYLDESKWAMKDDPDKITEGETKGVTQVFVHEDLNHPPMLWAQVDGTENASVIFDPNPQLKHVTLGNASLYHWKDSKGSPWAGVLVLPPGHDATRRLPLVIQTHGYSGERFFTDGYVPTGNAGRAFNGKEMIVLQMDLRLTHLSSPEEASDNLDGFQGAIEQLVSGGLVDRGRVGVIGFSRTCFHVLYALTQSPRLFAAASITDGVNFGYVEYVFSNGGDDYRTTAEAIEGGPPLGHNLVDWIQRTPTFNLDRVEAPLLISALERGTLLSEWEPYSMLYRQNKPVEMLWWWKENTPHVLIQPAQRYASQQSAVDWFDFWLNGHEDKDPAKAEQYIRWRQLRRVRDDNSPVVGRH